VDDDDGGIGPEGTAQGGMHLFLSVLILRGYSELAFLEGEAGLLIRMLSRLSRERHVLSVARV